MNIIVFGGTSGIGAALVQNMRDEGHTVLSCGRRDSADIKVDATDPAAVKMAFAEAGLSIHMAKTGKLDAVVCTIGSVLLKGVGDISNEDWQKYLATNLTAPFNILREAVANLPDGGSIVLFSAAAATIGMRKHEAIAAAKGAINGLVMSAAATYASKKIRINAVAPALVRTPLTESIFQNEKAVASCLLMHPLGLGTTDDVVPVVKMLLSNNWITGQIINVDGGLTAIK